MLPKVNVIQCDDADYLLLATHDAITTHLQASGTWESHLLAISHLFTHGIHEPLILDIGANLGAYAVPMAKHLDAAKGVVYAYEPQRIVYQQLCGNIFLNRLDNVHAFWMAVGDSDGDIKIPELDYDKSSNIGGFSVVASAVASVVGSVSASVASTCSVPSVTSGLSVVSSESTSFRISSSVGPWFSTSLMVYLSSPVRR